MIHGFKGMLLADEEAIITALESAHGVAWAIQHGRQKPGTTILANLSGRRHKDIDYVAREFGHG